MPGYPEGTPGDSICQVYDSIKWVHQAAGEISGSPVYIPTGYGAGETIVATNAGTVESVQDKQGVMTLKWKVDVGSPVGLQIVAPATFKSYEDLFRKRCASQQFDES